MAETETRSIAAGDVVTVVLATSEAVDRARAIVAGSQPSEIVVTLETDHVAVASRGDRVGLVWAGGMFDTTVVRLSGRTLTLDRPAHLTVDDVRAVSRTATSIMGRWRVGDAPLSSAQLIDLSMRGAQLLAESDESLTIGLRIELVVADDVIPAIIRRLPPADHPRLVRVGIEFTDISPEVRQRLARTIGSIKVGVHQWG